MLSNLSNEYNQLAINVIVTETISAHQIAVKIHYQQQFEHLCMKSVLKKTQILSENFS